MLFRPVDGGKTSLANIQPDGGFEMTVGERTRGAQIGLNHVLVVDAATTVGGETATYQSAPDRRVEVLADTDNEFTLEVSAQEGWTLIQD